MYVQTVSVESSTVVSQSRYSNVSHENLDIITRRNMATVEYMRSNRIDGQIHSVVLVKWSSGIQK